MDSPFVSQVKKLATVAWPLLIAQVTQTLMGVTDTIMAGRYGAEDMAAVAIGYGITIPVLIFLQGLSLALSPQIARFQGSNQPTQMAGWVQHGLYLVVTCALVFCLFIPALPWALSLVDMESNLRDKAVEYITYVMISAPAFALYQVLRNYCEGLSKTRPTMVIMITGLLVNIPANYIFINGVFGVPEFGGPGSGLATMAVFIVMSLATLIYVLKNKETKPHKVMTQWGSFEFSKVKELASMGVPIAFTLLAEVTLFALAAVLIAPFGSNTVAAHQIALNFSSLIFMLPLSIGMAAAIRIGHIIGEGKIETALTAYKAALLLALSTVGFTATATLLSASSIATIYSTDVGVITLAAELLIFAAIFQFSDAIQVVGANALRGYKDNKAMLLISVLSYWGVGFTTAVILGLTDWIVEPMAAKGFWIGFIVGLSTAAVFMTARVFYIQRQYKKASV